MADETKNVHEEVPKVATEESSAATGEVTDRGLFDFLGKKKEEAKPEETIESEFEHKAQISEPAPVIKVEEEEEEEKKPSLLEKLQRSDSSSSSSSEEEGEDGEKKKKKKDKKKTTDTEGEVKTEEEKKGFLEKLKEKLPGHGKKPEDVSATATATAAPVVVPPVEEVHPAEKKGLLEKIKEKLPGYHSKTVEEEKKEKESG